MTCAFLSVCTSFIHWPAFEGSTWLYSLEYSCLYEVCLQFVVTVIVFHCLQSILGGDFVMAMASIALARIRNAEVVSVVSKITEDLVRGTLAKHYQCLYRRDFSQIGRILFLHVCSH